jgi:hypothetical protein
MFIDIDIIAAWGGVQKKYNKGELIFTEGDQCRCYYQIVEGAVKMFNVNLEGREFTQGIFYEGESFGEPPLFTNAPYPASAEASTKLNSHKIAQRNILKTISRKFGFANETDFTIGQSGLFKSNDRKDYYE